MLRVLVLLAATSSLGLCGTTALAAPSAVPGSASPAEFVATSTQALASTSARSARAGRGAAGWTWSAAARDWTRSSKVLPAGLVQRGPAARITRGQFLAALMRVQALRGTSRTGAGRGLMSIEQPAPALADAPAGSAQARAVAYGWFTKRAGGFQPQAPITANEAALAVAGALGLRPSVLTLAARMRVELPGVRVTTFQAAHALNRTLGLRYNVLDPYDELELGPNEPVNVAHGAYMLHVATVGIESWKLSEAEQLAASFDLPALGPNQLRVLGTATSMLGQPYVWAGESEGQQAEGHGGFDCSGFTIRVINGSGIAPGAIRTIDERTTYTQSAIPTKQRVTRAKLQPGDAMFFGDNGPRSTPTQNFHAGVYMGNGWFIHSSGGNGGVAIDSLDGWWGERFSWGRRALQQP